VTVEGTVTRALGAYTRLQDTSGPTGASAIVIRQTSGPFFDDVADSTITAGTQLQVSGTVSEFPESNGILQINGSDLTDYTVQGQGSVPAPQEVSLNTLQSNGEDYESELVRVTGATFLNAQGTFAANASYPVTDDSGTETFKEGTIAFRVQGDDETALIGETIPSGAFNYTGVVGEFYGQYQLIPVQPSDAQSVRSFRFTRLFAQAQEGGGPVEVAVRASGTQQGDNVSVTASVGSASTATNGTDVTGFSSPQTLNFSGSDPAPQTLSFDVADDAEDEGVERLEVVLESNDGATTLRDRFTLWVLDDPTGQMTIAEGDSGEVLVGALQDQFGDSRPLGYDIARDTMYATIYNESNTVEGFYSGYQATVDPSTGDPSIIAGEQGNPSPQVVTLTDLLAPNGEEYESELVQVSGLSFPSASGTFSGESDYTVTDGDTTLVFRVQGADESALNGESIPTGPFTYEGVVGQYNNFGGVDSDEGYQLIPVRPETPHRFRSRWRALTRCRTAAP
jgi:DNA/RNA endonuclease YhcR with UshA esterase domain